MTSQPAPAELSIYSEVVKNRREKQALPERISKTLWQDFNWAIDDCFSLLLLRFAQHAFLDRSTALKGWENVLSELKSKRVKRRLSYSWARFLPLHCQIAGDRGNRARQRIWRKERNSLPAGTPAWRLARSLPRTTEEEKYMRWNRVLALCKPLHKGPSMNGNAFNGQWHTGRLKRPVLFLIFWNIHSRTT